MSDEKKIKVINGEGQETLVPEHIANDEPTLKRLLASFYGTDNFRIERKEENGETVLKVVKMAGSKGKGGAASPVFALVDCQGGQNPVILLYTEVGELDLLSLPPEETVRMQGEAQKALATGEIMQRAMGTSLARLAGSASVNMTQIRIPGF